MSSGFYGKLPMRGDFVGRFLGQDFIRPWDDWLQGVMQAGEESLAQAWMGHYLNSPIWHFVLGAELCGQAAMAGVMIASVDAVGRYFPLTVATPLPGRPPPALAALAVADWCRTAETVALLALEPDTAFVDIENAVVAMDPPAAVPTIPPLAAVTSIERGLAASLLTATVEPAVQRLSLWWTDGTPELPGVSLCVEGLPTSPQAVALFDGQWEHRGWNRR